MVQIHLEKFNIAQMDKKFPAFYATRRLITVFTTARNLIISRSRTVQPAPSHHISLSIWILSSHKRLGLYISRLTKDCRFFLSGGWGALVIIYIVRGLSRGGEKTTERMHVQYCTYSCIAYVTSQQGRISEVRQRKSVVNETQLHCH
jgi:N-acetyl-gamma-glutamylphosphate reductase